MNTDQSQEAARTILDGYDPADLSTWSNASSIATSEAEIEALTNIGTTSLRGAYRIHTPEQLREYDEAKQWLEDNPRFTAGDCDSWPLPNHEGIRASRLQTWLASCRISTPQTWIVPAEHALAYHEFMQVDLSDYRSYADHDTVTRLDELAEHPDVDELEVQREVAAVRTAFVRSMQEKHLALWQAAVAHREGMVREFNQLCFKAQTVFLDKQRAMSAIIAEVESEFLASVQDRIQEKLGAFGASVQQSYQEFEQAAATVAVEPTVESYSGMSL